MLFLNFIPWIRAIAFALVFYIFGYLFVMGYSALLVVSVFALYGLRYYIKWSLNKSFIQAIREDGPKSHLLSKSKTPTMGGVFFLVPFYLYYWLFMTHIDILTYAVWASMLFASIGLLDDLLKLNNKIGSRFISSNRRGLYVKEKLVLQLLAAGIFCFLLPLEKLSIPFFDLVTSFGGKGMFDVTSVAMENRMFDVKHLFLIPYLMFVMIGTVNAVNLTDGLDGLLTVITLIITEFISQYFGIELQSLQLLLLIFLIFNAPKAKIFMGDVGAFGLGALIAGIFIGVNQTLLLIWIGLIFVIETISVILQVLYYKKTNRRLFKMAPIHHHFEHLGYSETQIVIGAGAIQLFLIFLATQFFK